jgi:hypothetical protein
VLGALAVAVALLVVPVVALAQAGGNVSGLLVRVQGDLYLDVSESADLVMVEGPRASSMPGWGGWWWCGASPNSTARPG